MCGIAGYFSLGNSGLALQGAGVAVQAMNRTQAKRGPDDAGVWCSPEPAQENDPVCVLGHTRLAILDLNERSNQPMPGRNWVLVFNGEIYNFRAIRKELEAAGVRFETTGDTEVLLQSLETWGLEATLDKLAGMFAFAAYDRQNARLHLVRDRMGIKPLYFCERNDGVYFASSPAAIVHGVGRDAGWDLDWQALYSYFLLGATSGENSLFQGIRKVGAGERLCYHEGKREQQRYWTPQPRQGDLQQIFSEVFAEHREADVPSALFLSGGVDSSVLAVLMEKVNCFHLRSDESDMARYVAGQVGSDLEICDPAEDVDYEEILEDYATVSGDVSASSPIPYLVAQRIRQTGYPVAFSANGGDELFHGYSRTPSPELDDRFLPGNGYETPSYSCLAKQMRNVFRSPENFLLPNARDTAADFIELSERYESRFHLPDFPKSASHRWLELQTYVLEDLNPTLDYASMAHSVEVRVPFLDHRIVEAALTLDANAHITADYGRKSPLKAMLDRHGLHPMVWARPKMGFSLNAGVLANLHGKKLAALNALRTEGYLALDARTGETWRDFAYLGSAALAFAAWKRVWIDTGIVKA